MKLNWGTAIVIAFIGFIGFIMYFVINMSTDDKYDHDLVTEDYYQQELKHQEVIDKINNAKSLGKAIRTEITDKGIIVHFPEDMNIKDIKGNVFLYRPSNKQLDFEVPISLSSNNLLIPDDRLLDGRWDISVEWSYHNKAYLYKSNIRY